MLADCTDANPDFQNYYDNLPNQLRKDRLFELIENVSNNISNINVSRTAVTIHNNFQPLTTTISDLADEFPHYPGSRLNELLLMIKIIDAIESEVTGSGNPFDLTVAVDPAIFCIEHITRTMKPSNFLFDDSAEIENSIILFNLSDLPALQNFIDQSSVSLDLMFHFLSKLGNAGASVAVGQNVLIRAAQHGHSDAIFSCITLHLVKSGQLVHNPSLYSNIPNVSSFRRIKSEKSYQQFTDSLIILSEYNAQEDILDKYLRIYHLVEHFMFRMPIVSLERNRNNLPFSIRHFRTLYRHVEKNELDAIKDLIKTVMALELEPGVTFTARMFTDWQNIHPGQIADVNHINRLFELLQISGQNNPVLYQNVVNADRMPDIFAKLVYAFRNSIVHNKATEFHLNHETLTNEPEIGNSPQKIIEYFLLPWLEQISYYLIIEDNDLVWYHNPHLTLFTP
ncbi:hypothetical protein [Spirosoma flavus]